MATLHAQLVILKQARYTVQRKSVEMNIAGKEMVFVAVIVFRRQQ